MYYICNINVSIATEFFISGCIDVYIRVYVYFLIILYMYVHGYGRKDRLLQMLFIISTLSPSAENMFLLFHDSAFIS